MVKLLPILALSVSLFGQTLQQTLDSGQRYIQTPPGLIQLAAPLTINTSGQTVDFSASTLVCNFDADCLVIAKNVQSVTLINPQGAPTTPGGIHDFIADYGQHARIFNVTAKTLTVGWTFGHLVTVYDDQAFLLDGLDTVIGYFNIRCDATFCGSWVYAPGPFNTYSAVGWLKNLNINAQCQGNGVDWQSGNGIHISDSVIQGFNQFGVRGGVRRGGYQGIELDNVYEETGCVARNPLGRVGSTGVLAQGGYVSIHGGTQPHGDSPRFASTGGNYWLYFVTMNRQQGPYGAYYQMGDGSWSLDAVPLFLGDANTDGITPIQGQFPAVSGAVVYRVLRTQLQYVQKGNGWVPLPVATPPQGTGNWLVATIQASSCTAICQFTDPMTAPQSYTTEYPTQPNRDQTYWPDLQFWPGDLVLTDGAYILSNEPLGKNDRYTIINPWRPGN